MDFKSERTVQIMKLNDYRDEVEIFLKKIDNFQKNSNQKVYWLEKELSLLKKAVENSDECNISHQIYDMMYLLFELAADYRCDLDKEWKRGNKKKQEKYLKK